MGSFPKRSLLHPKVIVMGIVDRFMLIIIGSVFTIVGIDEAPNFSDITVVSQQEVFLGGLFPFALIIVGLFFLFVGLTGFLLPKDGVQE